MDYGRTEPDYLGLLAGVLSKQGNYKDAAEAYRAAIELAPRNPIWYLGLGIALRADQHPDAAREAFQRARDLKSLPPELQSYVERQLRELTTPKKK